MCRVAARARPTAPDPGYAVGFAEARGALCKTTASFRLNKQKTQRDIQVDRMDSSEPSVEAAFTVKHSAVEESAYAD